jgi:ABC-type branched-subunit amino acid transport system ATPase component
LTSDAYLKVEQLTAGYGSTMVIRDLSFGVQRGEIFAVLGKNGMGKSTLLKSIMGFVEPTSGCVSFDGQDVTRRPPHIMARSGISHTPQEYTLFQDLTVEENLALGVPNNKVLRERLDEIASFPVIAQRLHQRAGTLSGGEQKMLLLCRALIARPFLMLVDEITEGLQPSMVTRMAAVLEQARIRRGITMVLVEQNIPFALRVADRYAIMKLGEIVEVGTTAGCFPAQLVQHLHI